jgi:hypothetical protein
MSAAPMFTVGLISRDDMLCWDVDYYECMHTMGLYLQDNIWTNSSLTNQSVYQIIFIDWSISPYPIDKEFTTLNQYLIRQLVIIIVIVCCSLLKVTVEYVLWTIHCCSKMSGQELVLVHKDNEEEDENPTKVKPNRIWPLVLAIVIFWWIVVIPLALSYQAIYLSTNAINRYNDYGWKHGARLQGIDIHGKPVTNVYCDNNFDCYTKTLRLQSYENTTSVRIDQISRYEIGNTNYFLMIPIMLFVIVAFNVVYHTYELVKICCKKKLTN